MSPRCFATHTPTLTCCFHRITANQARFTSVCNSLHDILLSGGGEEPQLIPPADNRQLSVCIYFTFCSYKNYWLSYTACKYKGNVKLCTLPSWLKNEQSDNVDHFQRNLDEIYFTITCLLNIAYVANLGGMGNTCNDSEAQTHLPPAWCKGRDWTSHFMHNAYCATQLPLSISQNK
jgi:hypothetical protein